MCTTSCELKWISYLLHDLQLHVMLPITLHCDDITAIAIAKNLVFHDKTKHREIDRHIIRNMVQVGFLNVFPISTKNQPADLFTKHLPLIHMQPSVLKLKFSCFNHNDIHCEGGCWNVPMKARHHSEYNTVTLKLHDSRVNPIQKTSVVTNFPAWTLLWIPALLTAKLRWLQLVVRLYIATLVQYYLKRKYSIQKDFITLFPYLFP